MCEPTPCATSNPIEHFSTAHPRSPPLGPDFLREVGEFLNGGDS
ncbi:hypothetical protein PP504_gp60 [Gordonia phage Dolores]|uniref:Uncharacterized protein n=1 Tax=Gordonia phage Dolores TaxID=2873534 RepID=A0AAE9BM46_9CAUD|nr:hypothetical protein PP504_gp60 [Gordonia phage Dolores]UAJ16491.1 hypothetical protein SEA_DOLORES_60 [Gordonia phage Dolores]